MENGQSAGKLLKLWRERRRKSQLDLALDAEISTRHLSFVETGRAQPSREMILRLAAHLEIPLRERNQILLAGGYAPSFSETGFEDAAMRSVRDAIELILQSHEPFPALAVDRHWNLVAANKSLPFLLNGVEPSLLAPPTNVLRLSLHPDGVAPRILNFEQWREHILARLKKQVDDTADPGLEQLLAELKGYDISEVFNDEHNFETPPLVVPLKISTDYGVLSFISTTTVFGTPTDITVSEVALETFFPADEFTKRVFGGLK